MTGRGIVFLTLGTLCGIRLGAASSADSEFLRPVYELVDEASGMELSGNSRAARKASVSISPGRPVFLARFPPRWPPGWVPLFAWEVEGRFELHRRPPKGQENFTDPLFYALPCDDEPQAAQIAGKWSCLSTNSQGAVHRVGLELSLETTNVVGRFDPNTDYRFAFITRGSFLSNRLELQVEYIQDRYTMNAEWTAGQLKGTWRQHDDSNQGQWTAVRDAEARGESQRSQLLPLYEWSRPEDRGMRYDVKAPSSGAGWSRSPRPLCRVFRISHTDQDKAE